MIPHAWLGVGARHLAAFEAVARLGSFGAAGRELGYAQPAISQQVAALERSVGARSSSARRSAREARPTPAGLALLPHARAALAALATGAAALAAAAEGAAGRVRLGSVQSTSAQLVPALLAHLAAVAPGVAVEVEEAESSDALEGRVRAGALDAAFAMLPLVVDGLEAEALLDDPYVLLVARDDPLAALERVPAATVEGLDVLGLRTCRAQAQVEAALRLRVVDRHDDHGLIHGRVATGAAAVLPWLATSADDPRVRALPIAPAPPPRRLVLVTAAGRPAVPALAHVRAAAHVAAAAVSPPSS